MVLAEVAERSRYHGTIGLHTSFELVRFRQACALSGRRDALNASTIGGHAPAIACFMGRTLPQWAAARAALQRGAPPPHNVWISDVLLVVAVTLTGALLVAIAAVVALRREGWGHRVKASA